MKINIALIGGLETLFGGETEFSLDLDEGVNLEGLIAHMKQHNLKEREELFVQDNSVRPGIIVMINDTDWELLDTLAYELKDGDKISFISTLHGG